MVKWIENNQEIFLNTMNNLEFIIINNFNRK